MTRLAQTSRVERSCHKQASFKQAVTDKACSNKPSQSQTSLPSAPLHAITSLSNHGLTSLSIHVVSSLSIARPPMQRRHRLYSL